MQRTRHCVDLQNDDDVPRVSKDQFVELASKKAVLLDVVCPVWEIFDAVDMKARGYVDEQDVLKAVQTVMPHISYDVVRHAFYDCDKDGDGRLLFSDFRELLARQKVE